MRRDDFPFRHGLRVRYAEVDSQGIVFNAHYLTWFDTALTEYMRALDYDYAAMVGEQRLDFHVVKALVEYRAPVRADALVEIGVAPGRIGNSSIAWRLGVFVGAEPAAAATGEIVWVCSRVGEHRSHPVPADLAALLRAALSPAA